MGLGGWEAQREGIYVYTQLIHIIVQQKPTQYCKAIIPPILFLKRYFGVKGLGFSDGSGHRGEG